jgi:hypothetical protein
VRVSFDHNVPHKMRQHLVGHEVFTAEEMGWAELENGDLLGMAEAAGFPVMVTCDKNISYQQNLEGRMLALVVLSTNNWNVLKLNLSPVVEAVESATDGSFQFVRYSQGRKPRRLFDTMTEVPGSTGGAGEVPADDVVQARCSRDIPYAGPRGPDRGALDQV